MSTTTFGDIDTETETTQVATTAASQATKSEVAQPSQSEAVAPYTGDGPSSEDINIDHLQILGKSSQFDPEGASIGDICINKEFPIVPVNEPLRGILVHTRKYWKENVPYEDDTTPRFANTIEEKTHIENTTAFGGTVPVCDVTLLIERPPSFTDDETASAVFIYEFGGKEYALVKYTVQKSQAVRENYGTINVVTRARQTKGEDAGAFYFELVSKEKGTGTKFKWHQFVLKGTATPAPADAVEFVRSLRGE